MSVTFKSSASRLRRLASQTITVSGEEQALLEQPSGSPTYVQGYIDLSEMTANDSVVIMLYVKLKQGGAWRKYAEQTITGSQDLPILYIESKPESWGLKVSAKQTAGTYRSVDYDFFEEA